MFYRMAKKHFLSSIVTNLAILALIGAAQAPVISGAEYTDADKQAYFDALADTEVATQDEISTRLLAVVPGHDRVNEHILSGSEITWEGEPGNSRVLVATFMSRDSYENFYKDSLEQHQQEYVLMKTLWVTVVPELKNFFIRKNWCTRCPPDAKRVKEVLGLHPAYDYDVIVEMWVNTSSLFRPSPDPEITDHEAEIAIKIAQDHWLFPVDINPFLKLDDSVLFKDAQWSTTAVPYKTWFINRAQTIYTIGDEADPDTWGFPWTRLGYSYDWGNKYDHVGPSEFVLRIDPDKNGGEVTIKLERAIDSATPEWNTYFRCRPERSSHARGAKRYQ